MFKRFCILAALCAMFANPLHAAQKDKNAESQGAPAVVSSVPAPGDYYGVQIQVPTVPQWGQAFPFPGAPLRTYATAEPWCSGDSCFHAEACMLGVFTYGSTLPNAYMEFLGDGNNAASPLAYWCKHATSGACARLDVHSFVEPDIFGQTLQVFAVHSCGSSVVASAPPKKNAFNCDSFSYICNEIVPFAECGCYYPKVTERQCFKDWKDSGNLTECGAGGYAALVAYR